MFDKRLLQRMERARGTKAFDRRNLAAFVLHSESQAGIDALAVDKNCTGPARALVTPLLSAEKVQMLAQQIQKRCANIHLSLHFAAVNIPAHRGLRLIPSKRA